MQHSRAGAHRRTETMTGPPPARSSGRTPLQIADHNLRVTLEAIRRDGPLTRLELARRSGLTAPGLTNILRRLSSDGLVTARKRGEPGSGQPSMEFAINPDGAFGIGVRLSRSGGEAVLIDLSGRVRDRVTFEPADDLPASIAAVLQRLRQGPAAPATIAGIGIATELPGTIDRDALDAALHPLRVQVERDCVTAVLAERTLGVGLIDGGLVLVIIDDGVRAGLLLQGVPFGGVHGRAGGIGTMRTGADRIPLDGVAGLEALRAVLTPAECETLAAGGDLPMTPALRGWIKSAAGHLLDAIVATAGFVAPGAILIGGDLPRNVVDALIAQLSVERGDTTIRPFASPWISPIRPASFSGAGIAVGAALLPLFDLLLPSPVATA
jgi:predicted NBD/HSP70 family sugar kinase